MKKNEGTDYEIRVVKAKDDQDNDVMGLILKIKNEECSITDSFDIENLENFVNSLKIALFKMKEIDEKLNK